VLRIGPPRKLPRRVWIYIERTRALLLDCPATRLRCCPKQEDAYVAQVRASRGERPIIGLYDVPPVMVGNREEQRVGRIPAFAPLVSVCPYMVKNSCGAGIALEQSSEPLATLNRMAALFGFIGRF
jgi:hypothetical protein